MLARARPTGTVDPEWGDRRPRRGRLVPAAGAAAGEAREPGAAVVGARGTVAGIREVAARSGVSIATVSRVFNGSPRVSEDTRARVLSRARELNYVPNAAAQTLVRQRSQLLGVVLDTGDHPDVAHPFFQEVLAGLKGAVGELDYDLLLFAKEQHAYVDRALHHRVDGLLLLSAHPHGPELDRLLAARLPAVAVDLEIVGPRAGFVASDDAAGGAGGGAPPPRTRPLAHCDRHGSARPQLEHAAPGRLPRGAAGDAGGVRRRGRLLRPERLRGGAAPALAAGAADRDLRRERPDGPRGAPGRARASAARPARPRSRRLRRRRARRRGRPTADHGPAGQARARSRRGASRRRVDRVAGSAAPAIRLPVDLVVRGST